jgi:hypothetical protein
MATRIAVGSVLLPLAFFAGGCWQNEYAFPTADDVRMAPSEGDAMRGASTAEYGDVYALGMQSAHEVNGWIGEGVESAGRIIDVLEDLPPTSTDGDFDVFGPYHDTETDLSWLIRIEGDASESHFEVLVGAGKSPEVSEMAELLDGEMKIEGSRRTGVFAMSFDTVETYDLKRGPDRDRTYQGSVEVRFERDTESEHKLVEIVYDDFEVTQEFPIREYWSADTYEFRRNAEGAGSLHFDIASTFQAEVWSGPARERLVLDLAWNADGSGTGTEKVTALEGEEGDLAYGDVVLEECFDENGYFIWRELNAPYAAAFPEYNAGDRSACPRVDATLPELGPRR